MSEQTDALNGVCEEGEQSHHQCEVLIYHLQQLVQDEDQRHIADAVQQFHDEAHSVEQIVYTDVVCRGSGVSGDNESGTNEKFRESSTDNDEQIQSTGESGIELR
jgi:hypothetical protein